MTCLCHLSIGESLAASEGWPFHATPSTLPFTTPDRVHSRHDAHLHSMKRTWPFEHSPHPFPADEPPSGPPAWLTSIWATATDRHRPPGAPSSEEPIPNPTPALPPTTAVLATTTPVTTVEESLLPLLTISPASASPLPQPPPKPSPTDQAISTTMAQPTIPPPTPVPSAVPVSLAGIDPTTLATSFRLSPSDSWESLFASLSSTDASSAVSSSTLTPSSTTPSRSTLTPTTTDHHWNKLYVVPWLIMALAIVILTGTCVWASWQWMGQALRIRRREMKRKKQTGLRRGESSRDLGRGGEKDDRGGWESVGRDRGMGYETRIEGPWRVGDGGSGGLIGLGIRFE